MDPSNTGYISKVDYFRHRLWFEVSAEEADEWFTKNQSSSPPESDLDTARKHNLQAPTYGVREADAKATKDSVWKVWGDSSRGFKYSSFLWDLCASVQDGKEAGVTPHNSVSMEMGSGEFAVSSAVDSVEEGGVVVGSAGVGAGGAGNVHSTSITTNGSLKASNVLLHMTGLYKAMAIGAVVSGRSVPPLRRLLSTSVPIATFKELVKRDFAHGYAPPHVCYVITGCVRVCVAV